jgi:serine/threonine protein kinase/Flp pilus assembly protein TadD
MSLQPRYRKGDRIGGRYLVHQALMGGMGEVYLCLDQETNQPYALKTFQARYLTNLRIRQLFAHEVGTWVALEKHPNIVRCFLMETLDNQPFMLLEWVAGEEGKGTDLRSWLRHGSLDLRTTLDFTIDICRGLIHANLKQPGIVHRDLKPENILVGSGKIAKITDFGLATLVRQAGSVLAVDANSGIGRQTIIGSSGVVGTPSYMAPEQWRGEPEDARTDIYAVGCIIYELLTGAVPYPATTIEGFRQLHTMATLPVIATNDYLPNTLNTLIGRCLAKHPDKRFASAAALLDDLTELYRAKLGVEPRAVPATAAFTATDYTNRGLTYHDLGRFEDALTDYTHAIQLDHTLAEAYSNRGNTYDMLGRIEDALANYAQAISLDPTLARPYYNRGLTYANIGHLDDAFTDFTQAIERDPALAPAYTNRGNIHDKLGRSHEALADFTQAITLDPTLAQAYSNRGLTYHNLEQFDNALADFGQAIKLNPTLALAYFNRGVTNDTLGWFDEALADYTRTVDLDPTLGPAYFNLGVLLANQGKLREALPYFEQAAELGLSQGVQYATQIRRQLGIEPAPVVNPTQQAVETFQLTTSLAGLQQAVTQFPFMIGPQFIAAVEQVIAEQVPPEHRPTFEQRLIWLREIAGEQQ